MTAPSRQLRALNQPRPVQVRTDAQGMPRALVWRGRERRVDAVGERWRIDDEWWRTPISRRYLRIVLETGVVVTLYLDLKENRWYLQGA